MMPRHVIRGDSVRRGLAQTGEIPRFFARSAEADSGARNRPEIGRIQTPGNGCLSTTLFSNIFQIPWPTIRPEYRTISLSNSRSTPLVCVQSAGLGREPHNDRQASRSHADPDDRPIRTLGTGLDPERRSTDHRQHWREPVVRSRP